MLNGDGLRTVLWVAGCTHNCKGCQNPQTWDFESGTLVTAKEILKKILGNPLIHGITFSGGEPFEQAEKLIPFAAELKRRGYHLMAFSGYTFEELIARPACKELLSLLDILVDGPFIEEQKSLSLRFRGSKNQRILNLSASRKHGWIPVIDPLQEQTLR